MKQTSSAMVGIPAPEQRAAVLGRWLWFPLWLLIPQALAYLLNATSLLQLPSVFTTIGRVLSGLCSVLLALFWIKLAPQNRRYRTAGIWYLLGTVLQMAVAFFLEDVQPEIWFEFAKLAASLVGTVGTYHEYTAHAEVLCDVEAALSNKWRRLWQWYIGLICAEAVCVFLTLAVPIFGALVMLAALVGTVVVAVLGYVYLYQTTVCFREYAHKQ